jgi:hypothetical protein
MPIKIIKRGAVAKVYAPPKERTKEESHKHWKEFPGPNAKPRECPFCLEWYIRPCDNPEQCGNYQHMTKRKRKR